MEPQSEHLPAIINQVQTRTPWTHMERKGNCVSGATTLKSKKLKLEAEEHIFALLVKNSDFHCHCIVLYFN